MDDEEDSDPTVEFTKYVKMLHFGAATELLLDALEDDLPVAWMIAMRLDAIYDEDQPLANAFRYLFRWHLFLNNLCQAIWECDPKPSPTTVAASQVRRFSLRQDAEVAQLISQVAGLGVHEFNAWLAEQWQLAHRITSDWSAPTLTKAPAPPGERN